MTQHESGSGIATVRRTGDPADLYASLHRAIERETADERTWCSLVRVCIELGRPTEALEAFERIESFGPKTRARTLLVEAGWLESDPDSGEASDHVQAVTTEDMEPSLPESVTDSLAFLVGGQIPVFAMKCIIGLGLVLAFGGMLHSALGLVVATLVTVPVAFAVIGWCGALAQRVFLTSCTGYADPPDLPEGRALLPEIRSAARDLSIAAAWLLVPALGLAAVVDLGVVQLLVFTTAWALVPFVFAVRQLRANWRESGPALWGRLIRARPQLLGVLLVNALLFAPCALTMHYSMGLGAYLIVCFCGMLGVVPLIASVRIFGQVLYYQRDSLEGVLDVRSAEAEWAAERIKTA